MHKSISGVKKIAVLRSNAIGDYIVSLPALVAIKAEYPFAELVLFARHWHKDFLQGRPGPVDSVEVVPFMKGIYETENQGQDSEETILRFFKRMQKEQFDIAIQLYGGGRFSNPFIKNLNARVSAGMCSPSSCRLDRWIPYYFYHNEIMRLLEVAALVGAAPVDLDPRFKVTDQDKHEALKILPKTKKPFVLIHPGSSDPRRRWKTENFAKVADELSTAGAEIIITGTCQEQELAEKVISHMKEPAFNSCSKLSLKALAGAISFSYLIVSSDTGPLHLARAIGIPTVGIYWVGNVINAAPSTVLRNRTHISWQLDCPVCGLNCIDNDCSHRESFVDEVKAKEVALSAKELFLNAGFLRNVI